jgi:hypothetical protein
VINEHQIKLKPTNNKARVCFFALGVAAALAFALYLYMRNNGIDKASLVGLLGLLLLTASLTFYTKYLSSIYYYEIAKDPEGTPLFLVKQIVGKRGSALCRIALYEIRSVERTTRAERKAHKTPLDHRKYSYTPTFMPEVLYRLTTASRYEKSEIYIEISDDFATLFKSYIEEARAISDEDDE